MNRLTTYITAIFGIVVLAIALSAAHHLQGNPEVFNFVWLECGLLHKYSITAFAAVVEWFNFDGVYIQPFLLNETGLQKLASGEPFYWQVYATEVYEDIDVLCGEMDELGIQVFLFVGAHNHMNSRLIELGVQHGYVLLIDDGIANEEELRNQLSYLKQLDVETGLVHWHDTVYKTLIQEGLVDYSTPCFYPYWQRGNLTRLKQQFTEMSAWTQGYCRFLPAIQVFGGGVAEWDFPTLTQIEEMKAFLYGLDPYGVKWFEPWTGQSLRGECFEGFLDHPEVWYLIKD